MNARALFASLVSMATIFYFVQSRFSFTPHPRVLNCTLQAREKDATVGEKKLGLEMAQTLKGMIAPYFLRRTKAEVKQREKEAKDKPQEENVTHAV